MEVNYGIHQMTAQKFNNEAACVFLEHRKPFLNCVLNGTVIVTSAKRALLYLLLRLGLRNVSTRIFNKQDI